MLNQHEKFRLSCWANLYCNTTSTMRYLQCITVIEHLFHKACMKHTSTHEGMVANQYIPENAFEPKYLCIAHRSGSGSRLPGLSCIFCMTHDSSNARPSITDFLTASRCPYRMTNALPTTSRNKLESYNCFSCITEFFRIQRQHYKLMQPSRPRHVCSG